MVYSLLAIAFRDSMIEKYKSIKTLALETIKLILIGISMISFAIYILFNIFYD